MQKIIFSAFGLALFSCLAIAPSVEAKTKQISQTTESKTASWDGTWSGTSSNGGRKTTVKISKGKVVAWTNNGFPRAKVVGSVSGNKVSLDDLNGWKGTITLQSDGKARITASGVGNNGKPAKNSAVLVKR